MFKNIIMWLKYFILTSTNIRKELERLSIDHTYSPICLNNSKNILTNTIKNKKTDLKSLLNVPLHYSNQENIFENDNKLYLKKENKCIDNIQLIKYLNNINSKNFYIRKYIKQFCNNHASYLFFNSTLFFRQKISEYIKNNYNSKDFCKNIEITANNFSNISGLNSKNEDSFDLCETFSDFFNILIKKKNKKILDKLKKEKAKRLIKIIQKILKLKTLDILIDNFDNIYSKIINGLIKRKRIDFNNKLKLIINGIKYFINDYHNNKKSTKLNVEKSFINIKKLNFALNELFLDFEIELEKFLPKNFQNLDINAIFIGFDLFLILDTFLKLLNISVLNNNDISTFNMLNYDCIFNFLVSLSNLYLTRESIFNVANLLKSKDKKSKTEILKIILINRVLNFNNQTIFNNNYFENKCFDSMKNKINFNTFCLKNMIRDKNLFISIISEYLFFVFNNLQNASLELICDFDFKKEIYELENIHYYEFINPSLYLNIYKRIDKIIKILENFVKFYDYYLEKISYFNQLLKIMEETKSFEHIILENSKVEFVKTCKLLSEVIDRINSSFLLLTEKQNFDTFIYDFLKMKRVISYKKIKINTLLNRFILL